MHPFTHKLLLDKIHGTLIGAALGDCVGLYTEFMTSAQAVEAYGDPVTGAGISLVEPHVTPFSSDSHRNKFEQCAWTDDTDHTLLVLLSYLRKGGKMDPRDVAQRLRIWVEQGLRCLDRLPFGLGQTVGRVVTSDAFLSDPISVALDVWKRSGRNVAPNGSLMRTSIIGICCLKYDGDVVQYTEEQVFNEAIRMGEITHADPRCAISVAVVSGLVWGLCLGTVLTVKDVDDLLERAWEYVSRIECGKDEKELNRAEFERHAYARKLEDLELVDRTMGYVYKCLGSSLLILRSYLEVHNPSNITMQKPAPQDTFRQLITTLVFCGGDADTNATVAAALLGAASGYSCLPAEWRDGIKHLQWYKEKIWALCYLNGILDIPEKSRNTRSFSYVYENDPDTELYGGRGMLGKEALMAREQQVMQMILQKHQDNEMKKKRMKEKEQGRKWGMRW